MDLLARFAEVTGAPDGAVRLDEAALVIAAHGDPAVDVDEQLGRLDELAGQVGEPTLDGVRRLLFRDLGFSGNDVDYYDPRNSYLHEVLDRRTGIPISLAVLLLEVGRRVGVPLAGVSMPGHFLVRDKVDPEVFVDPFARGAMLDRRGAQLRFHRVHGPQATFHPSFLDPVPRVAIVLRMLANLEGIATRVADRRMLLWVRQLRALLPDASVDDHRRLAAVLASVGRLLDAAAVLESRVPDVDDEGVASDLSNEARALRAKLN